MTRAWVLHHRGVKVSWGFNGSRDSGFDWGRSRGQVGVIGVSLRVKAVRVSVRVTGLDWRRCWCLNFGFGSCVSGHTVWVISLSTRFVDVGKVLQVHLVGTTGLGSVLILQVCQIDAIELCNLKDT